MNKRLIVLGFIVSAGLGLFIVPVLKKFKIRQTISGFVGNRHSDKNIKRN